MKDAKPSLTPPPAFVRKPGYKAGFFFILRPFFHQNNPSLSLLQGHLWAVLLLLTSLLLTACGEPSATPTPTPNPAQEGAKIDSVLRDLLISYQSGGLEAARTYARNAGLLDEGDRVRFGLTLTSAGAAGPVTTQVKQLGGEVYSASDERLGVAVELSRLTSYFNSTDKRNFFQELASFKEVREVKILLRPALAGVTPDLATLGPNEGIALVGADRWQKAGFGGRGITVGIIDGGFAGYRAFLGTALPAANAVEFQSFLLGQSEGSEAHGVAVAEIVHGLAPEARLVLAPIEDEIGFTRAVQMMIDRKVQIIQISLGWAGIFPGDGTGKMDEKLDEARRAGILPIVSTGNYGLAHYSGLFDPDARGFHRYGPEQTQLKLTTEGQTGWVALRWEEPWNAPRTNLDLFVLDSAGRALVSSRNEQAQAGSPKPPSELAPFRTEPGQRLSIQVKLTGPLPPNSAPHSLRFHLFTYNARLEEAQSEGSIATPGDARGALSVGATNWKDDRIELYSSRGPTVDGRAKPELMGPTGVSSQVFRGSFAGTSAAAPQVAGTAALVWSAAREMSAEQVALYLSRNALDLAEPGRDARSGFGRVRLGSPEAARLGLAEMLLAVPNGLPFEDDFRDSASGLPNNPQGYYGLDANGPSYLVAAPAGQLNWNSYLSRSFEEFRASVAVRPPPVQNGSFCGLIFWQQGPEDYWAWLVSGSRYALMRRNGPTWTNLTGWSQDAALEAGSSGSLNLSLEATAEYIRLRVGPSLLQSVPLRSASRIPPPARLGGKFGLIAGQFGLPGGGGTATLPLVAFNRLQITPLTTR